MKEDIERINKLKDFYEHKFKEISEAPVDSRPKMLRRLYRCGQKNKHLGVTITSCGALNVINHPKYPPELGIKEESEIHYDTPPISTFPADYKPYDYKKYFNQTIKTYQGHLEVDKKLVNSIRGLLGPGKKYTANEVKDTISIFKFKKDLVDSIVCKLNGDSDYRSLTEIQKSCFLDTMKSLETIAMES